MMENTHERTFPHWGIPFLLIADQYGFLSSYLYTPEETSGKTFTVVFNKRVLHDKKLTDSAYKSLSARMVDYKYFKKVEHYDCGIIAYTFNIPEKYHDDIKKITESKYSKVSKAYKIAIAIYQESIPDWNKEGFGHFLCRMNFSVGVTIKLKEIKEEMIKTLGCDIPDDIEFLSKFDKNKETFDPSDYCK